MTAYTDFTSDFPRRCLEVLDTASADAAANGREITLLLMAVSASLLVPFERLKPDTEHSVHPSGDNKRYGPAADRLKELLDKQFVGSVLCPATKHSWQLAKDVQTVEGAVDSWLPKVELKSLSASKQVGSTLTLIRNALAHGSIYATGDPIKELVFVKEVTTKQVGGTFKRVGFEVVKVSHSDFLSFVRAWIAFLQAPDKNAGSNS